MGLSAWYSTSPYSFARARSILFSLELTLWALQKPVCLEPLSQPTVRWQVPPIVGCLEGLGADFAAAPLGCFFC